MQNAYSAHRSGPAKTCLGLALLFVALAQVAGPSLAQDGVIPNASFEELDPATACPKGWTPWAQTNWAVFTLAAARTGLACAAITDDSAQASQGLRSPRILIEPGKTYRASAWVKIERVEKGGFAVYLEYWRGTARVENESVYTSKAPDWSELALQYPAPADATEATVLIYSSSATIGRAYFDDVSLTLVAK